MVMDVRITVTFGVSGDMQGYIIKASVLAKIFYFLILVVAPWYVLCIQIHSGLSLENVRIFLCCLS